MKVSCPVSLLWTHHCGVSVSVSQSDKLCCRERDVFTSLFSWWGSVEFSSLACCRWCIKWFHWIHKETQTGYLLFFFLVCVLLNEVNTYLLCVITCCFSYFSSCQFSPAECWLMKWRKSHIWISTWMKITCSCARCSPPLLRHSPHCPVIHGSNQIALLSHWAVPVSLPSHLEHPPVQNSPWIIVPLQQGDEWFESVSVWFLIHTDDTWTAQLFVIHRSQQRHGEKQLQSLFLLPTLLDTK